MDVARTIKAQILNMNFESHLDQVGQGLPFQPFPKMRDAIIVCSSPRARESGR